MFLNRGLHPQYSYIEVIYTCTCVCGCLQTALLVSCVKLLERLDFYVCDTVNAAATRNKWVREPEDRSRQSTGLHTFTRYTCTVVASNLQ